LKLQPVVGIDTNCLGRCKVLPNIPHHWTYNLQWVSDCCLMPIQQFFSYIIARTS
jgi:hypothetical protein